MFPLLPARPVMCLCGWLLSIVLQATAVPAASDSALVVVGPDTLFVLRGGLGPFSAGERAAALSTQLTRYMDDSTGRRDPIRVVEGPAHATILAGDLVLLSVLESDATPAGTTPGRQARHYADLLRRSVDGHQGGGAGRAALATAVSIVAGLLGFALWRKRSDPQG